ncbi:NUDIX hydrolase [Amycolatopsis rubida]|uniref:NUDIX hydrolase n=1 Tax=Amycolatopsis rubida TaxID=112413 RepID=A0ABX0BYY2_9PSEU|nr:MULTISPECIES: NUDIX hydrolase [Amycolatopsis]MYW93044.1 NUDIX domain-containing protein [Amycolatopsis rubida]NEC58031.1 NUDIX hydrolase [Amycolatopsis rubida]OAP20958.1 ADP-ribose pyrophosphatase [Amycolatopsis sp. M39]
MRWKVHGERELYHSDWVQLCLSEIEFDSERREHHLIRLAPSVGIVIVNDRDQVLMLWRHRFTTDTWNWELPGGWMESGESPAKAAAREAEEETGWRPRSIREIGYLQPIAGITDAEQYIFLAEGADRIGPPPDAYESDRVAWVPLAEVPGLIRRRQIVGGVSVAGLLQLLTEREPRGEQQ